MPNIEPRPLSLGERTDLARRQHEYALYKAKAASRGAGGKGEGFRPTVTPKDTPYRAKW